ncbi:hypothetical protein BC826DRAFT_1112522 [Russula brevipes]|nr:hypothetical protein BC826DRAFT_1112522 [Russula brevipes]
MEEVARQARRKLEGRKTSFLNHQNAAKERLRAAKVMERLHPYLEYEEQRGENMWVPAQAKAYHAGQARKTSTRRLENKCKFCLDRGHFNWECERTHLLCQRIGGNICKVYPSHANVHIGMDIDCPFRGRKLKADKGKEKARKPSWGQDGSQERMM